MRYLGVNVIKYLRKHLEEGLAGPGRAPSWDGTKGRAAVEPWPTDEWDDAEAPERVWDVRTSAGRLPTVIGAR